MFWIHYQFSFAAGNSYILHTWGEPISNINAGCHYVLIIRLSPKKPGSLRVQRWCHHIRNQHVPQGHNDLSTMRHSGMRVLPHLFPSAPITSLQQVWATMYGHNASRSTTHLWMLQRGPWAEIWLAGPKQPSVSGYIWHTMTCLSVGTVPWECCNILPVSL